MKKHLGIIRNRTDRFANFKKQTQRKKNRFHIVGKEAKEEDDLTFNMDTDHSEQSNKSQIYQFSQNHTNNAFSVFEEARVKMRRVTELQRKMAELSKARLSCLRQKENERYDNSITKLAGQATQLLLAAETGLRQIKRIKPSSSIQTKMLKSMEASLAVEIQELSHSLRQQQQDYFRQVKAYEGSTINSAIQLTPQQKQSMKSEWESVILEERQDDKGQIGQLVSSITRLSALYKELSQLVVSQGTIIDRIDYNLQQTEQHTIKAVVHLQGANAAASSAFAQKIIRGLAVTIILLALILGLKYMK